MSRCFADGWFHFAGRTGVLAAVVAGVSLAAAESSALSSDTLDLPPTATRGARVAPPASEAYALRGDALRRFATLEDALATLPGFRTRAQDGLGGYSELRFRGARAAQIDVTVDGIRLNQDGDAAPDLGRWPVLWFSSLEAGAAAVSGDAGPGALARIDLSTRPEGDEHVAVRGRLGSFGAAEGALSTSVAAGRWSLTAGVQGQAARNDYRFFSDNGTSYNTEDDATWRMENNAWQSRGVRVAARRTPPGDDRAFASGFSQTVSLLWLQTRKEYPGLFPATARAYGMRSEWLGAWRAERARDLWGLHAGVQARRASDAYRDPAQSLGYLSVEAARASLGAEADLGVRRTLASFLDVRLDAKARGEESGPRVTPYSAPHAAPDARRGEVQAGAGLAARLDHLVRGLELGLQARRSAVRFRAEGLVSGDTVGLLARAAQSPYALRASAALRGASQAVDVTVRREQRAPSSGELLGDNVGVKTKLDLRPEETRAVSASYAFTARAATLRATVYRNLFVDPIRLRAHSASPFLRYENGADYEAVGAEARVSTEARWFEGAASATLQRAEILEGLYAGKRPAYESPLEATIELFAKPAHGVRAGPAARYRGPYYPGDANTPGTFRDGGWELDAHASVARGPVRAALDARNLGDRRERDFVFSPRSGRSYSFTLSLEF